MLQIMAARVGLRGGLTNCLGDTSALSTFPLRWYAPYLLDTLTLWFGSREITLCHLGAGHSFGVGLLATGRARAVFRRSR